MAVANEIETMLRNAGAVDTTDINWSDVPNHPLSAEEIKILLYFMSVEANTIIYLKEILSTAAANDPKIQAFMSCWAYEEYFHGHSIRRFLNAYGVEIPDHSVAENQANRGIASRLRLLAQTAIAKWFGDRFIGVHMAWGAANELTVSEGYLAIIRKTKHPILADLLMRIQKDERRHFAFYYKEAADRMADPKTATLVNTLIRRFFEPVGADIRDLEEVDMVAMYLFNDDHGMEVIRSVDRKMGQLPGMEGFDGLMKAVMRSKKRFMSLGGGQALTPTAV